MSEEKILVTGATGTVGASVVTRLLAEGEPVRAAVRELTDTVPDGAESARFDFADSATWDEALDGVDRMFLIRPPAISDVKTYLRPAIARAADHRLRQVVFLSVMGVNRLLPHWQVERDLEASELPHTVLRSAFFAQNLLTAYRRDIIDHDRIRLAAGRGRTSFVDTRDVADVAALALQDPGTHAGSTYTLTGPAALSWYQVATLLSARLGRPIDYQPIGLLRYRRELLAQGMESAFVNVQLVIGAVATLGLADRLTPDVRNLLGHDPIALDHFVADHLASWRRPERGPRQAASRPHPDAA
jgi:uncharacterized protein YbjT (DUF2867 family)